MSRSKEWLIPLLYEHLVAHLRRAVVQIRQRDFEGKGVSLEKASAIIIELMATLDKEQGGELAQRLSALYAFWAGELLRVGRTLELAPLEKMIEMVADLQESWVVAARAQAPEMVSGAEAGRGRGDSLYDARRG